MSKFVSMALALLAVLLILIALASMISRNLAVAGLSFLSASLVIYLRETRFTDG